MRAGDGIGMRAEDCLWKVGAWRSFSSRRAEHGHVILEIENRACYNFWPDTIKRSMIRVFVKLARDLLVFKISSRALSRDGCGVVKTFSSG